MNKRLIFTLLIIFFLLPAHSQTTPNLYKSADRKKMKQWVDSIYKTLTLDEKIGQLFMLVADPSSSYHERIQNNIRDQKIGGVLFSGGRLPDQAKSMNLYQEKSRVPLLMSFDGEWGLAMRLKEDTPLFPHNMMLGAVQDMELLRLYGKEVGRECNELGVHINFAPVIDVNINPSNPVIGNRSFGEDPYLVSERGIAYARGLESRNVIAVGKHFPGHGDTNTDSHKATPRINHNRERLESVELYPFRQFINSGFSGVMTGHLAVSALDNTSGLPTSLSPIIIKDLLIEEMGFTGLTFTDALVMQGATGGTHNICVQALLAGNDVLLSPGKPVADFDAVRKAVESGVIPQSLIEEKCRKILQYKYIVGLNNYKPIQTSGLKDRINSQHAQYLIKKLNEAAITLLKNEGNHIPLKELDQKKTAVVSIGDSGATAFYETLSLYGNMDHYQIETAITEPLLNKLKGYDRIVVGIHSSKADDSSVGQLKSLCRQREVHLCFFISPYRLNRFKGSIEEAHSVTLAYENTRPAQEATAEVIMGGVAARGKLPVTVSGLFEFGTGLSTHKVRLSYGSPEEVGMSGAILSSIEQVVNEGIKEKAFPGCQVLVAKDGVVVYNRAFGHFDYASNRPVTPVDLYDLASITKAAATVPAVMKLYDTKKIKLDDKLSKYIPQLRETDKNDITIRNALYHESALRPFLPFYTCLIDPDSYTGPLFSAKNEEPYTVLYDKNVYMRKDFNFDTKMVSHTPRKGFGKEVAAGFYVKDDIRKDVLGRIVESPLRKLSSYTYSDLNFILLKEMIDEVSGEEFDQFLDKNFYERLGANYTMFLPLKKVDKANIAPTEKDEFLRDQLLKGHVHDEAAAVLGGVSGNAGLFSNANDLAKLLQMLLYRGEYGGETYLSKQTVNTFINTKSPNSRRGLGFDKPDMNNPTKSPTATCVSANTFGHTGYTGTCFWVDPEHNLIFVFLSNRVYPSRTQTNLMSLNIRPRIQAIIYQSLL